MDQVHANSAAHTSAEAGLPLGTGRDHPPRSNARPVRAFTRPISRQSPPSHDTAACIQECAKRTIMNRPLACGVVRYFAPCAQPTRVPYGHGDLIGKPLHTALDVWHKYTWHLHPSLLSASTDPSRHMTRHNCTRITARSRACSSIPLSQRLRRSSRDARAVWGWESGVDTRPNFEVGALDLLARKRELASAPETTSTRPLGGRTETPEFGVPSKSRTSRFRAVKKIPTSLVHTETKMSTHKHFEAGIELHSLSIIG